MAEFQEENLFTGAQQSQGFAPAQAPDISPFLRENMEQVDRNFAQLKSQQQAKNQADLRKAIQTYEGLAAFSPKFMELAKNLGEAYITNQMIEGNAKTRSLGLAGVDLVQQANFDATVDAVKQESAEATKVALEAHKNGAPPEALEYIKSLPQYQRIAGMKNYLANRKKGYQNYLTKFLTSQTIQLPGPDNTNFTPDQIDDDPVKLNIALDAAARMYDIETGVDQFSKAALVDYNEGITTVNAGFATKAQERSLIRKSDSRVSTAIESFKNDLDINALVSEIAGTLSKEGVRSYADALDMVYKDILPSLRNSQEINTAQFREAISQAAANDPKGRPHSQFYRTRIFGKGGTWDKVNGVDEAEFKRKENERKRLVAADREDFFAQTDELERQGIVLTDDQLDERLRNVMERTGIYDPSLFSYYSDYKTKEEQDVDVIRDELNYLRSVNGRGYLIAEDLRGKPAAIVTEFSPMVAEDEEFAKFASSYNESAKRRATSLVNEIWTDEIGKDEKTTKWNKSYDAMYSAYLTERDRVFSQTGDHNNAHEKALDYIESKRNEFKAPPSSAGDLSERQRLIETLRTKMTQGVDITNTPNLWSDEIKENLNQFNKGLTDSYDPIFDVLAMGSPGFTGWDIANKLYRRINGTDLKKTVKQEAIESYGPAVQRFIRASGATPNRIARGERMDNPQGTFKPSAPKALPAYSPQVSSIVMEGPSGQPGMDIFFEDKQFPAVLDGIVKDIRYQVNPDGSGYGHFVVVESVDPQTGDSVDVLYAHFDNRPDLKVGQQVAAGQVIGKQGGSGSVRSVDGTIASIDFLAPRSRGSNDMTPYRAFETLRMYIQKQLKGGAK